MDSFEQKAEVGSTESKEAPKVDGLVKWDAYTEPYMTVDYYDKKNSILLFSTDAWAQSGAIHLLKFRNNDSFIPIYEKFLTDGGFH